MRERERGTDRDREREREEEVIHDRAVILAYQVLDFPIKTFACFLVDKYFPMNSDRDASKLFLLIYYFLYFTITSFFFLLALQPIVGLYFHNSLAGL